jgi:hypothetical protein
VLGSRFCTSFPIARFSCFPAIRQPQHVCVSARDRTYGARTEYIRAQQSQHALPESEALPSVVFFAECLLSGTRQRRLCRVPPSVTLGSRQRAPLPSAEHSVQVGTRQRQVCRVSHTRQTGLSAKGQSRWFSLQSASHGGRPCSTFSAYAMAHKGKATSDVTYNPDDGPPTPPSTAASMTTPPWHRRSMTQTMIRAPSRSTPMCS